MYSFQEVCDIENEAEILKLKAQQLTSVARKSAMSHTLSKRAWIEADKAKSFASAVRYRYNKIIDKETQTA